MDPEVKKGLFAAMRRAEIGLAKSALRWKYGKEGEPDPQEFDRRAEEVARQARGVVVHRGKRAWQEIRKAYRDARRTGSKGD